jgi:DNA ligase-associated metallophosphoesterase
MNSYDFMLNGTRLSALPSGALWWRDMALLAVSDLHLGRSGRIARLGGALLPPYEARDTLGRLDADLTLTGARTVICVGDSFDDMAAADEDEDSLLWLARMAAGRRWIWVAGNHDPGPFSLAGEHRAEVTVGPLTFRHIASKTAVGEVSGHYHPKARVAGQSRPCFLFDRLRLVLPAYGAYTGGLLSSDRSLASLLLPDAIAVLTGTVARPVPMPR